MKSKTQVLKERSDFKTLINGVINSVGIDSVENINTNGVDQGYPGMTYYSDTHKFAMRHRKSIVRMLEELADNMGTDVVTMVSRFRVFRGSSMDKEDKRELYKFLGGGRNEQSTITNLMAWFAAEEVCRMFED